MAVIRPAGSLRDGIYLPSIGAPTLMEGRQALGFAGRLLAVFSRPVDRGEEIEWVRVGRAPNGVLVLDPGPFGDEDEEDVSLELLLVEEFGGGRRDNRLVIEGPRLVAAEIDGHRWWRVSLALAPTGWAEGVAAQFQPGKDGLRQVFRLPEV